VAIKMRQGRKAVTLITGFEPFLVNADELGEELRKVCAAQTSGTSFSPFSIASFQFANCSIFESVTPITSKSHQMEVLVQGKQGKAVMEYLINKGIPKKWIVVDDSTKKK
jgi:translation initiation factor 2D